MRRFIIFSLVLGVVFVIGLIYGIGITRDQVFPYKIVKRAYDHFSHKEVDVSYGPWSIGIYTGSTPFDLADSEPIINPVITAKDVDDIDAKFVADPFMVVEDDGYYMFFEVMNRQTGHGDIGYAESKDGVKWKYRGIIIDEDFHLSYPYVFKWEDNFYLIPDSSYDYSIRLYVASVFPGKWKHVVNLMNGHHYVDPSILRKNNKWWLFASVPGMDALDLFYSDELIGPWQPHPQNPLLKRKRHHSRPGGRVFSYNDHLYRLTQDDEPKYGIQVFAFEITTLSETSYAEKKVETPVVTYTGSGWNAVGMHTVDPHKVGDRWIAAVDGKNY
jgi:hypothetical protein